MPSALDLSEEWLCDTGAAQDLISRDKADNHTDFQSPAKHIKVQTANGDYRAETALSMNTPALGEGESRAYIMDHTPSALSVGQRVMNRGTVSSGSRVRNLVSSYPTKELLLLP